METFALIKVWLDHICDQHRPERNDKVHAAIVEALHTAGIHKSLKVVRTKIENIGNKYRWPDSVDVCHSAKILLQSALLSQLQWLNPAGCSTRPFAAVPPKPSSGAHLPVSGNAEEHTELFGIKG
ncbi:hypothetical protein MRX96_049163 [Rhipicephalus microplus]